MQNISDPLFADKKRPFLKKILPQTLFGRSLLIIAVPLILLQVISLWVFYDRHWENVTGKLAGNVAGDINFVAALIQNTNLNREEVLKLASEKTGLLFRFVPSEQVVKKPVSQGFDPLRLALRAALKDRLKRPFNLARLPDGSAYEIHMDMGGRKVSILVPEKRLFSSTTYIYLIWVIGLSVVLFAVALVFMRNQIRPIRRLAQAAENFGKGRTIVDFPLRGAREVRQAARAFQVMKERIQRQITQRTEMLAGVSHDLRTPLTRMKLQMAMLPTDRGVENLKNDIRDMETMIESYLAFARGEGEEAPQNGDLIALTQDILSAMERIEPGKIFFQPKEPMLFPFRPQAMKRCIGNIVGNGLRYASHVWVDIVRDDDNVAVIVDDDGPGISKDRREQVFQPFFRLEDSRNPATGGVGLGLTIARDIARSHGGDVTLEDSPKGGLRVIIRLPL